MSGPVQQPLKVKESDNSVVVRPCVDISFNAADFSVAKTGNQATISIDSTGTGAALTDTYIGFGNASNLLTGSADFTFTADTGTAGPIVLLTGNKPIWRLQDDTDATDYKSSWEQSGNSLYLYNGDSAGNNYEVHRISPSYVWWNRGNDNIDMYYDSANVEKFFTIDVGLDSVGIGGTPDSAVERLHVKGVATDTSNPSDPLVRFEVAEDGATKAPVLEFYRNSASPADNDYIGGINFSANDFNGDRVEYARIFSQIRDVSAATQDADLQFQIYEMGTPRTALSLKKDQTVFNENGRNIDFRIESSSNIDIFKMDAGNSQIGIGAGPDSTLGLLQVNVGNSTQTALTLISTDADAAAAPTLQLFRNSASPAISDVLGRIEFAGEDDGGSLSTYTEIDSTIRDTSAGSENGDIRLRVRKSGTMRTMLRARESEVVVNEDSVDCNFRVESNGNSSMLNVDAGLDRASVGAMPISGGATFQVPNNTISSYCNLSTVRSDATAQQNMTNDDMQGQTWVNDSSTAWTILLPEGGLKGQWCDILSTDGNWTVTCQVGDTLNGVAGSTSVTRNTNNAIYRIICISNNIWVINNPE